MHRTPSHHRLRRVVVHLASSVAVAMTVATVLSLAAPATLAAQSTPRIVTKVTADLGYVQTGGNTNLTTLNIGERFTQQRGRLSLQQQLNIVYSEQRDTVRANQLRLIARGDYRIDQIMSVFVAVTFDRNRFAGIQRRFDEQIGIQARLFAGRRDTLRIEGGGTVTQEIKLDGVQKNFPAARAAGAWRHAFNRTSYFHQTAEFLPNMRDADDWRLNTESTVVAPVSSRIGLKVSYVVRYDNLPAPGFVDSDRLFTTGLQLTF
ncbi:MAG: YdiY family protein [Gemmatimonadota bacterium]